MKKSHRSLFLGLSRLHQYSLLNALLIPVLPNYNNNFTTNNTFVVLFLVKSWPLDRPPDTVSITRILYAKVDFLLLIQYNNIIYSFWNWSGVKSRTNQYFSVHKRVVEMKVEVKKYARKCRIESYLVTLETLATMDSACEPCSHHVPSVILPELNQFGGLMTSNNPITDQW